MTAPREAATGPVGYDEQPILQAVDISKTFTVRTGFVGRSGDCARGGGHHARPARGSITAIVGESGSGKTTISRMLAGITRAHVGTPARTGARSAGPPVGRARTPRHVQLVLQDPFASLNPVPRFGTSCRGR